MKSKYEVASGLFIGSEIGDINKQIKIELSQYINGDSKALYKVLQLSERRRKLLLPRKLRKVR